MLGTFDIIHSVSPAASRGKSNSMQLPAVIWPISAHTGYTTGGWHLPSLPSDVTQLAKTIKDTVLLTSRRAHRHQWLQPPSGAFGISNWLGRSWRISFMIDLLDAASTSRLYMWLSILISLIPLSYRSSPPFHIETMSKQNLIKDDTHFPPQIKSSSCLPVCKFCIRFPRIAFY